VKTSLKHIYQRFYNLYRENLIDAYKQYQLENLSKCQCTNIDGTFMYEDSMQLLFDVFERDFLKCFSKYKFSGIEQFVWKYEHLPNNIMIEKFVDFDGKLNSIIFESQLERLSELLSGYITDFTKKDHLNINVPFCGYATELTGLANFLKKKCLAKSITINLTDNEQKYLSKAEKCWTKQKHDSRIICRFNKYDLLVSNLKSADLVVCIHPQILDAYQARVDTDWRIILSSAINSSEIVLIFCLTEKEAITVVRLIEDTHVARFLDTANGIVMPREYLKNAKNSRKGLQEKVTPHVYYRYGIVAKARLD